MGGMPFFFFLDLGLSSLFSSARRPTHLHFSRLPRLISFAVHGHALDKCVLVFLPHCRPLRVGGRRLQAPAPGPATQGRPGVDARRRVLAVRVPAQCDLLGAVQEGGRKVGVVLCVNGREEE